MARNFTSNNMAAATGGFRECTACFRETKYGCIICLSPICNLCATSEKDDRTEGWIVAKRVGYCEECTDALGLPGKPKKARSASPSVVSGCDMNKRTNLAERYLVENDTELESDLGDEVHDDDQDEMEEVLSNFTKKRIKKPGRKATWHESTLNDVVDIVVSSEYFRKRLIFQNTKNQKNSELYSRILKELKERAATRDEEISFTPVQLRNKFKKLVSECKKSALTIKSASGIKRFQDQKGYGAWFDKLYALVKTRDSCQPELAREPSMNQAVDEASLSSLPDDSPESDTSPPLFVPIKKTSKKKGKGSTDEVVDMLRTLVENDPLKEFLKFAKEEAEKAREHEMRLLQMLMGSQAQPQSTSYQVPTAGYQGHAGFYQSQAVYPCTPPNRQNNQQNMTYDQNVEENERLFYQNL